MKAKRTFMEKLHLLILKYTNLELSKRFIKTFAQTLALYASEI